MENKKRMDISAWLLLAAAFLIMIFFLWYFFIYVNSQEKLQIQKSFRVLTQLGENLKNRYNSYRSIISSTDMDSMLVKSFGGSGFKKKNNEISKYFFGLETVRNNTYMDDDYIYFRTGDSLITDTIKCREKEDIVSVPVNFRIGKSTFFLPIARKDVFDEIIFIKHAYGKNSDRFFYSTYPGDLEINQVDSIIKSYSGISSGGYGNTKIAGIDYKLFLIKTQIGRNDSYYIGGLINGEKYTKETRAINYYLALLLLILFITFLMSIPLFKLKMTSENQDLKIADLLLSTLSIIGGASFVLLVLLSILGYFKTRDKIETSLRNLSDNIKNNFITEVKKIDYTLTLFASDSLIINKGNLKLEYPELDYSRYIKLDNKTYNYFKLIFRLDSTGFQDSIISARQKTSSKDNYSYRKYFTESGEWRLDGSSIMLDFIISSTSGEQLGVVSKKKNPFVYVVTARLNSVINTILPPGYGFCIIDKSGDVKFHSESARMLRENFLAETENSSDLVSALYSSDKRHFIAKYLGQSHLCYVQPVNTLPLYLVTFYDNSYSNSVNLQVTTMAFVFLLMLHLMFFFVMIGSRIADYRKSELKKNLDVIEFLRPSRLKMPMYKKMMFTNTSAILLIIISCWLMPATDVIFLIFIYVLIQLFTATYYANYLSDKERGTGYSKGLIIVTALMFTAVYYLAVKAEADLFYLIILSLLLVFIDFTVLAKYKEKMIDSFLKKFRFSSAKYFHVYLFSWFNLIVTVPIILFFIFFYNYETGLELTSNLYSIAQKEAERNYEIDKFYNDYISTAFYPYKDNRKLEGLYLTDGISRENDSGQFDKLKMKSGSLDGIFFYIKQALDKRGKQRRSLVKKHFNDTNEEIVKCEDSIIVKYTVPQIHYTAGSYPGVIYYKGKPFTFELGNIEVGVSSILLLIIILLASYKLIIFTADRIFGLSIKTEDNAFLKLADAYESGNNVIIHPSVFCENVIKKYASKPKFLVFDYQITGALAYNYLPEDTAVIIINNVDLDLTNPKNELKKFAAINKIIESGKYRLFLIFNQGIEKIIENNRGILDNKTKEADNAAAELQKILEDMDNKYTHIYSPLIGVENKSIKKYIEERLENTELSIEAKAVILDELTVLLLPYVQLKKYSDQVIRFARQNSEIKNLPEKIIIKIQETAQEYYETLWLSCTKNEKLLLDDIADNLLLNDKNVKVIKTLSAKGFLKKGVSIRLVNQSFRNYINIKCDEDEEKEYLQVRKKGNWAKYRAPLILVLLAIAFFIVLQENLLSNIYSILTMVLGIVTIVTKISGIFTPGGAKLQAGGSS